MTKTEIIKINLQNPEKDKIKKIAKVIKVGGVVVFPTDTVYGLGGDALNKKTIKKIFQIKKRALNKPLLINIARKKDLKKYVKKIPSTAKPLIKNFWPGPLTIIFEKSEIIPNELTNNSPYIGIRIPNNKITLKLIKEINSPLISTSANVSGKATLNNIEDIIKTFKDSVDIIIDGGNTTTNKGSTIIDLTKEKPLILRKGAITDTKLIDCLV